MTELVALAGDYAVVDIHARRYLKTADAINDAARELITMVQSDGSIGDAFEALHDLAYDVSKNISKAEKRYRTTAEALIDYAEALRLAKELAERSIQQAGHASADVEYWTAKVREYQEAADRPGPDQVTDQQGVEHAKHTLREFTVGADAANRSYDRAVNDRDHAAVQAMKLIESVVQGSKLNDSLLDDLKGFVTGLITSVVRLLKQIVETVVRLMAVVLLVLLATTVLTVLLTLLSGPRGLLLGLIIGALVLAAVVGYVIWAMAREDGTPSVVPIKLDQNQRSKDTGEGPYASLLNEQARVDAAGGDADHNGNSESAVVSVTRVVGPDGVVRWRVVIPSTQDWLSTGGTPNDFSADLVSQLSPSQRTQLMKAVTAAMEQAGVDPGDPVMLQGFSLGGICAAQLAASTEFTSRFNVTAVMTEGSPIAQYRIPSDINVLSIEHPGDLVPNSDFLQNNPESTHQHTITPAAPPVIRDASGNQAVGGDNKPVQPNLIGHGATDYRESVRDRVDNGRDPATTQFVAVTCEFFEGSTKTNYYRATRG